MGSGHAGRARRWTFIWRRVRFRTRHPEAALQVPHAVPRDGEPRMRPGLQANEHVAVHARTQLMHKRDVDDRRPVDPHELPRVETCLESGPCRFNDVLARFDYGEGQLVA